MPHNQTTFNGHLIPSHLVGALKVEGSPSSDVLHMSPQLHDAEESDSAATAGFSTPAPIYYDGGIHCAQFSWPQHDGNEPLSFLHHEPIPRMCWDECDSCDPLSTLLPGEPWSNLPHNQCSNNDYASSSSSDWTASAQQSAASSPYMPADTWYTESSLTPIKMEDSKSPLMSHMQHTSDSLRLESSSFASDHDFDSHSMGEQHNLEFNPPVIKNEDTKRKPTSAYADAPKTVVRAKREHTRPENARYMCSQCGKLFARSYNLRAHLQTHDPERKHPHTCSDEDCDRRFVRRADLARHERSVHEKVRDYTCTLCNRRFARKDTLQRHEDAGCPSRSEVKKHAARIRRTGTGKTRLRRSKTRLYGRKTNQRASLLPTPPASPFQASKQS